MIKNGFSDNFTKGMSHWEVDDNEVISNYTKWQMELIMPYIGKRVLEIGAGSGRFTALLNSRLSFNKYTAIEPSQYFFNMLKQRCPDVEMFNLMVDELDSKFNDNFDTIILIHILEHIEDDEIFLKSIERFLMSSGKIIIIAPALKFLMSELDRAIGHYRRYEKKKLGSTAERSGYKVIFGRYNNFVGLFGWLWCCKIRKLHYQSKNKKRVLFRRFNIFDKVFLPIISKMERALPIPIGLNLIAVIEER